MNRAVRATAQQWLAAGVPAVVVEVKATRGSVPREAGTRMLVATTALAGTVGGGHLELQAIALARELLNSGQAGPLERHFALGPTLGQCCGGAMTLRLARLDRAALAAWPLPPSAFTLQLYGAGHVGRAIVGLLAGIDCRVQWIDEREEAFPAGALPPQVEAVCVPAVEAEVDIAPPGCSYLVLTHNHDLDARITEAVLRRGDFGYLGLIGSRTKRARFLHRFEDRGVPAEALARLTCPIGVPGIRGKQPEVIAVSVVAQLLQQAAVPST
ncbi:xanthine dehydrogenase accessory protein XdhC [Aquabacterium sp. A7-Y]|uniref:xanthine dehydrogenase accessory protein XdhC n=1 Tax=Aquabacterium sp. A7-Y TaxID=1349605 RepID=UPI00223E4A9E|nr:xanthine dehydrogenase accessory protein XdhC [Aquabacterium sp. A7-Y]MCW7537931.1 xanthine dehydrogenase accessory protein XdhC [Aquabacterium sp. A7-Y]